MPTSITKSPLQRFLGKPWRDKINSVRFRLMTLWKQGWNRLCPFIPLPVRLPYGGWWLAKNDVCSDQIFLGNFENAERRFVEQFLKEGMTVLDIGAHHGFYTLLAARKVGPTGCVIAFEPSPRERSRLRLHVKLNRCPQVRVEHYALASEEGASTLFLVQGRDTGCNSLRPPLVSEPIQAVTVSTATLDSYLQENGISRVDFIKMDVEGAELEILRGAERTLSWSLRPVFMVEVQDCRTVAWGYAASRIFDFLSDREYRWFSVSGKWLQPCPRMDHYNANLIAVPKERMDEIKDY